MHLVAVREHLCAEREAYSLIDGLQLTWQKLKRTRAEMRPRGAMLREEPAPTQPQGYPGLLKLWHGIFKLNPWCCNDDFCPVSLGQTCPARRPRHTLAAHLRPRPFPKTDLALIRL